MKSSKSNGFHRIIFSKFQYRFVIYDDDYSISQIPTFDQQTELKYLSRNNWVCHCQGKLQIHNIHLQKLPNTNVLWYQENQNIRPYLIHYIEHAKTKCQILKPQMPNFNQIKKHKICIYLNFQLQDQNLRKPLIPIIIKSNKTKYLICHTITAIVNLGKVISFYIYN